MFPSASLRRLRKFAPQPLCSSINAIARRHRKSRPPSRSCRRLRMLNWRLSLLSLRRCRSDKADRDPKERASQMHIQPRRDRAMAGRGEHATLRTHNSAKLRRVADRSGKPCLPIGRTRRRLHSQLHRLRQVDIADEANATGAEIGRPNDTCRRVRIESPFGKVVVLVSDGHLPLPYGR
jgi:hypothetical protein